MVSILCMGLITGVAITTFVMGAIFCAKLAQSFDYDEIIMGIVYSVCAIISFAISAISFGVLIKFIFN